MVSADPSMREPAAGVFAAIGYLMEPFSSGAAVNVPRKKRRTSSCFASVPGGYGERACVHSLAVRLKGSGASMLR